MFRWFLSLHRELFLLFSVTLRHFWELNLSIEQSNHSRLRIMLILVALLEYLVRFRHLACLLLLIFSSIVPFATPVLVNFYELAFGLAEE